jgi:hypothetical protein
LCFYLKLNKPFEQVTSYAKISEQPKIFANEYKLQCSILGWGKNQFDQNPRYKVNIASVYVKYGPDACKVPPDKYVFCTK